MTTFVTWNRSKHLPTETSDRPEEHDYIDECMFSYVEMLAVLRIGPTFWLARNTDIDPKKIGL